MKVINPPFTLMIAVSQHLSYTLSSNVRIFFSIYFFCRDKVEVLIGVSGSVRVLKKPGGGKNTHSFFNDVFSVSICISSPNREKWSVRRVVPFSVSVLDSNTNAPSSTYIMQNNSNSILDENVPGRWLTNCPVDLGELSMRANWAFISPRAVHSSSSVSAKAIIKNINSTEAMLSPCLNPNLNSMDVSTLTMMRLTTLFSYMLLIAERSFGGAPYFPSMAIISA